MADKARSSRKAAPKRVAAATSRASQTTKRKAPGKPSRGRSTAKPQTAKPQTAKPQTAKLQGRKGAAALQVAARKVTARRVAAEAPAKQPPQAPVQAEPGGNGKGVEDKLGALIALGKEKGYLTIADIDTVFDQAISPPGIEQWLDALRRHGVDVVESPPDQGAPPASKIAAKKEDDSEDLLDDPVRLYLRKMRSFNLLTREGEVEIAKRFADGQRQMLQVLLSSHVAVQDIVKICDDLKSGKIRVREVVSDLDDEDVD